MFILCSALCVASNDRSRARRRRDGRAAPLALMGESDRGSEMAGWGSMKGSYAAVEPQSIANEYTRRIINCLQRCCVNKKDQGRTPIGYACKQNSKKNSMTCPLKF